MSRLFDISQDFETLFDQFDSISEYEFELNEKGEPIDDDGNVVDPETAKAIRDDRLPEDDHSDTCSMCGKFCAVRSMNKALAGEHIDIL